MTTFLVATFLVLHGLLHPGVWTAPVQPDKPAPFDPGHSRVLSAAHVGAAPARATALALAWYTALLYAVAGAGAVAGVGWWPAAAVVAAASGLALKAIWFDPWLTVGVLLDVGVIVVRGHVMACFPLLRITGRRSVVRDDRDGRWRVVQESVGHRPDAAAARCVTATAAHYYH